MTAPGPIRPTAVGYDAWAATYDDAPNPTRDLDAAVLRRAAPDPGGGVVVELGCGTGKNTAWLAERARSVVALDVSRAMLARARRRVPSARVRFVRCDVTRPWPLADGAADRVVGNLVLEHVASLAPVFREAFRVLRPGGEVFFCEFHPFRQLQGKQARFTGEAGEEVKVEAWLHDVSEYVNGAVEAGFRIVRVGDWRDPDAAPHAVPRLFSLHGRRPDEPGTRDAPASDA